MQGYRGILRNSRMQGYSGILRNSRIQGDTEEFKIFKDTVGYCMVHSSSLNVPGRPNFN